MDILKPNVNVRQIATGDHVILEAVKFIRQRYEIRYNPFLNTYSISTKKGRKIELNTGDLLGILKVEGFKGISKDMLDILLKSGYEKFTVSTEINPIIEYLNSVRGKYQGTSHIDKFSGYLQARKFADGTTDQERLVKYFKKWFVSMVATVLGKTKNDVMFVIAQGRGGTGKTRFIEHLTNIPELEFYHKLVAEKTAKIDIMSETTKNILIFFDELAAVKRQFIDSFKGIISAHDSKVRHAYQFTERKLPRLASFAGTTNHVAEKGGFIPVNDMGYMRRLCVVENDCIIDFESYLTEISHEQMYAEALLLIESTDYDYVFNNQDYENFSRYNRRYLKNVDVAEIIGENFTKGNGHAVKMTAEEISQVLIKRNYPASVVNPISVGKALSGLGYEKITARMGDDKTPQHPYLIELKN